MARRALLAAILLLAALAGVRLTGLAAGGDAGPPLGPGEGEVRRTVDGDTLVVRLAGGEERVRLIGIDSPESVDPRTPVECFGREAARRAAELLPEGTGVRLERDVEARDRYGRLLAYVYRRPDDLFVNLALVEEGYATAATFPPNVAHTHRFVGAAAAARSAGAGLWSACPDARRR